MEADTSVMAGENGRHVSGEPFDVANGGVDQDLPPNYSDLDNARPPPYSPSFLSSGRIFDIPEAPPDYFSVVNRIQDARRDSDTCCNFLKKAIRHILAIIAAVVLLLILMSVPIAMLGVGAAYIDQCSIQPLIPIYLVVVGISGILKSIETIIKHFMTCIKCSCLVAWRRHPKLKYLLVVWRVVDLVFNLLVFGWVIAGSYWIFSTYKDLHSTSNSSELCNPVLYRFAFGMMISSYIVVGLTCCSVCVCALCRAPPPEAHRSRHQEREEEEGEREGGVTSLQRHYHYHEESVEIDDWGRDEQHREDNGAIYNEFSDQELED